MLISEHILVSLRSTDTGGNFEEKQLIKHGNTPPNNQRRKKKKDKRQ